MLKNTNNPIILGIFLGLIGAIAASILAVMADYTKAPIKANQKKIIAQALSQVLPPFTNNPDEDTYTLESADKEKLKVKFFGAKSGDKLIAVAGQTISPKGYAGKIQVMVSLDLNGKVRTVIVTKQNETPGLGTVVCDRKRVVTITDLLGMNKKKAEKGLAPNSILDQFSGRAATKAYQPWKVIKDGGKVKYITGATITSRAVTGAVYRVAHTFAAKKQEIIKQLSLKK